MILAHFLSEALKVRKQWCNIFKVLGIKSKTNKTLSTQTFMHSKNIDRK